MRSVKMDSYEEVADYHELSGECRAKYLKYMKTRWGNSKEERRHCICGYAGEWAERFKGGYEYESSDTVGQQILDKINKELI